MSQQDGVTEKDKQRKDFIPAVTTLDKKIPNINNLLRKYRTIIQANDICRKILKKHIKYRL